MKCHICKEDNSFWEMQLIKFPKNEKSNIKIKYPICKKCLKNIN